MTALYVWGAITLLLVAVAAWRPAPLQGLITRSASACVAPALHVQQVLARTGDSLRRAIRHLAISEGAPFTALAMAEHHLGGLAMGGFFLLGIASEWLLLRLVLAGMFDAASPALPDWLPSWTTNPENAMALGLLCAGTAYGFPLLDVTGQTYVSNWGQARPVVRRTIATTCILGLLGCLIVLGLMGWMRMVVATTPIEAASAATGVEGYARLTGAMIPVLLGVALVFAAAIAMNVPKTAALIIAVGLWLLVSAGLVVLGLWNSVVNAIHVALLQAVTWSASLFRRDESTRSWIAAVSPAGGVPGYAAWPVAADESGAASDAPAASISPIVEPMPTDVWEGVAPPPPQGERDVDADDPNWRAF